MADLTDVLSALLMEEDEANLRLIAHHLAEQGSQNSPDEIIRYALRFAARRLNGEVPTIPRDKDRPVAVHVGETTLEVTLKDGRIIGTPLAWYPRLQNATPQQLRNVELMSGGVYWPELDEDLSVRGMLMGDS